MACDYLTIQASSVPSEDANSKARCNFEDRDRLHACTFKTKICIKFCLDILDVTKVPLPEDINETFEKLEVLIPKA